MRRSSTVFVVAVLACAVLLGGCTPSGQFQNPIFVLIPTAVPSAVTRAPSPTIEVIIVTATQVPPTPTEWVTRVTATPEDTATPAPAMPTPPPAPSAVPTALPSPVASPAASPQASPVASPV